MIIKIDTGDSLPMVRTINTEYRVTIPKEMLDRLKINPGDEVDIYCTNKGIVIQKSKKGE